MACLELFDALVLPEKRLNDGGIMRILVGKSWNYNDLYFNIYIIIYNIYIIYIYMVPPKIVYIYIYICMIYIYMIYVTQL